MTWRATRCLVTGATGFIGTALCRRLEGAGAVVHRSRRAPVPEPRGPAWHACDVTDLAQVRSVFQSAQPEVVFHLASKVTGSRGLDAVLPTLHDNLVGTVNVLHAAKEIGQPRVICLGSLQEPDEVLHGVPPSPYAAAKFAAGAYARMFAGAYSLPVTIARPFMVYGPGQMDFSKLVPYVVSRLLRGQTAELSSGLQPFDWVYVDDVVEGLLRTAATDSIDGQTIDLGSGEVTSVRDVANGLAARLGAGERLKFDAIENRRAEPMRKADVQRTYELIGWKAATSLEAGLDRTVEWYRRTHQP
jgi:UDP-glucose 4-epimerase